MSPVEKYLHELREIRSTGAGVKETTYDANLLDEVGKTIEWESRAVERRGSGQDGSAARRFAAR